MGSMFQKLTRLFNKPPHLQVGALCLRKNRGQTEVLLISSLGTGRWIIPKGWPMRGKSLAAAAQQEAWEEAGVNGAIQPKSIGCYHYMKERDNGLAIYCEVQVFVLTVKRLREDHPEAGRRKLRWVSPEEAAALVGEPGLKRLIAGVDRHFPLK